MFIRRGVLFMKTSRFVECEALKEAANSTDTYHDLLASHCDTDPAQNERDRSGILSHGMFTGCARDSNPPSHRGNHLQCGCNKGASIKAYWVISREYFSPLILLGVRSLYVLFWCDLGQVVGGLTQILGEVIYGNGSPQKFSIYKMSMEQISRCQIYSWFGSFCQSIITSDSLLLPRHDIVCKYKRPYDSNTQQA